MLYCGSRSYNSIARNALAYIPDNIKSWMVNNIGITVLNSDAFRLAHKIKDCKEVIVLSPWVFSYIPPGSSVDDDEYKYFIFCVLHEIAHAYCKHLPPDELSNKENDLQESEANQMAIDWYNSHLKQDKSLKRANLPELDLSQIEIIQKKYKEKTKSILEID